MTSPADGERSSDRCTRMGFPHCVRDRLFGVSACKTRAWRVVCQIRLGLGAGGCSAGGIHSPVASARGFLAEQPQAPSPQPDEESCETSTVRTSSRKCADQATASHDLRPGRRQSRLLPAASRRARAQGDAGGARGRGIPRGGARRSRFAPRRDRVARRSQGVRRALPVAARRDRRHHRHAAQLRRRTRRGRDAAARRARTCRC